MSEIIYKITRIGFNKEAFGWLRENFTSYDGTQEFFSEEHFKESPNRWGYFCDYAGEPNEGDYELTHLFKDADKAFEFSLRF